MPLKKFNFMNTPANDPADQNWRTFDEASKTIVRNDLVFASGAVNSPTIQAAYFVLYGPLVFYQMRILMNNNDGWGAGAIVELPYPILYTTSSKTGDVGHLGTASVAGIFQSYVYINLGGSLTFQTAYTNVSGSDKKVFVQGWYLRN